MRKLITLCALALAAGIARADTVILVRDSPDYGRRHFFLGAEGVASAVLNETGPHNFFSSGGGINLFFGGRVHRHLALEFGWQPTFHGQPGDAFGAPVNNGLALSAFTLDFKILPLRGWVQPYIAVGPAGYVMHDWSFHYLGGGGGYQVGGGVDFWLFRHLSVGGKIQYRGAALTDFDAAHDTTYLSMITFAANVTGHF